MKILKIATHEWKNASRDKRELSVYKELGHDVVVMCKGEQNDYYKKDVVDGFDVVRFTTKPLGNKVPKFLNSLVNLIKWTKYAMSFDPDVISGENPNGALIGLLAKKFSKENNVKLIYDAHEFHIFASSYNFFKKIFIRVIESIILKNSSFAIIVNNSILCEMKKIYKFSWNSIVLLSTPNKWAIDLNKVKSIRDYYNKTINKDGNRFIIEFHGFISRPRKVEMLINLLSINKNISLVIIGDADNEYKTELEELAKKLEVSDRLLFHESVNVYELGNYLNATDLGIIIYENLYKNFYYMSPNKFFENIQSENPVLCSGFPELKYFVEKYNIGLLSYDYNVQSINESIEIIRTNKVLYESFKKNLLVAKNDLCWENEKNKLIMAFNNYI